MSLKGHINNYAKKNGIAAQVVLQNYMFERFLERLSRSEYQEKFVVKPPSAKDEGFQGLSPRIAFPPFSLNSVSDCLCSQSRIQVT